MRKKFATATLLILAMALVMPPSALAQSEKTDDKTLSPYFFVKSDDPQLDQLPLKSTSIDVNIAGVIADVTVSQVYKNKGKRPLEAVYIFPASARAAVYGMKMRIGERTITAKIRMQEQARKEYEQAKQAGKSASLLEQHRPNVFQMNVANILPEDVITVELKYTEMLVPTDAEYEFVYPTVVGPRFSDRKAAGASATEKWVANPYLTEGKKPTNTLDIRTTLNAGLPIRDISCNTHKVNVNYKGADTAKITLDPSESQGGNRDFILKYRLAGSRIQSGMLLYEGKEENFFQIMLQPPKRVKISRIPPREYIFVVDVSGSMNGFPLDISKKFLKDLISTLRPTDQFNVILFASGSNVMNATSLPATSDNIRKAVDVIDRQRGGGGTHLLTALKKALAMSKTEGLARTIVTVTDGFVAVEPQVFDMIRNSLGDANMFAFGIGSSVNRHLIEGMARVGMGEPFIITRPEQAPAVAEKFRQLIQTPVLTNIKLDYGKFEAYDVEPLGIPDVLAERPVIVFGKYRGKPKGTVRLTGITGGRKRYEKSVAVSKVKPLEKNSALRYLWARHRIALLADYNRLSSTDERVKEVTNLGLTYNLMTAYTSFVAVDTQKRLKEGQAVTVKQPLPLPQGVSGYAVGGSAQSQLIGRSKMKHFALPSMASNPMKAYQPAPTEKSVKLKAEPPRSIGDDTAAQTSSTAKKEDEKKQHRIELAGITMPGGWSKNNVETIVKSRLGSINQCYRKPLEKHAKLNFIFTVDTAGRVINVITDNGKKKMTQLEKCIREILKKMLFAPPSGGKNVEIKVFFAIKT